RSPAARGCSCTRSEATIRRWETRTSTPPAGRCRRPEWRSSPATSEGIRDVRWSPTCRTELSRSNRSGGDQGSSEGAFASDPVLLDHLQQDLAGGRADVLVHHPPLLEQEERRDALDPVTPGDPALVIDVDLPQAQLSVEVVGQPVQNRGHHPAGSAPLRPEIDQDRRSRLLHFRFKVVLRQRQNVFAHRLPRVETMQNGQRSYTITGR